jgi:hypothetical protein
MKEGRVDDGQLFTRIRLKMKESRMSMFEMVVRGTDPRWTAAGLVAAAVAGPMAAGRTAR